MFRGAMVGLIHSRSLLLQDGVHDDSAAITLMSTDVGIICENITRFHEIWAQVIEVTVGLGLLARQLGWVSVVPLLLVICKFGTLASRRQKIALESHSNR